MDPKQADTPSTAPEGLTNDQKPQLDGFRSTPPAPGVEARATNTTTTTAGTTPPTASAFTPQPPKNSSTQGENPALTSALGGLVKPAKTGIPALKDRLIPESLRGIVSVITFIGCVLIVAMLINNFIFQSYYVDGTSMEPTLQNNDRLIIDKTAHTWADVQGKPYIPKRGEIIVLDSSIVGANGHNEQLIKRVIGLPGETVIVNDGTVTIKNKDHHGGFVVDSQLGLKLSATYVDEPVNVTLSKDQLFVMGDNRSPGGSFDSREFGPIEATQVEGRLVMRVFPFTRVGIF